MAEPDTTGATAQKMTMDDIAASMIVPKNTPNSDNADTDGTPDGHITATLDDAAVQPPDPQSGRMSGGTDEDQESNSPLTQEDDDIEDSVLDEQSEDDTSSDDDAEADVASTDDDDVLFSDIFDAEQERASDTLSTDDLDTSKLGDDLMIPVTVDEEEVLVPLGELKKRHAGEGAIDRRLQEASELRRVAEEDYSKGRQLTEAVLQEFGQALFRRTVPQPSDELMNSDINEYTRLKALYDRETEALTSSHQQLHTKMQQLDQIHEDQRKTRRLEAAKELRRIMPVFNNAEKAPKVRAAIVDAAKEIGFTDTQIAACEDPLIFKAVALAARELKRQKGVKVAPAKEKARTLATKGTRNKSPATVSQRKERDAFNKARDTGKVDDVAATMIVSKPRKRGRR